MRLIQMCGCCGKTLAGVGMLCRVCAGRRATPKQRIQTKRGEQKKRQK